jgi:hypothetical protein
MDIWLVTTFQAMPLLATSVPFSLGIMMWGSGFVIIKKTFPQAKKGRFYGAIYMKQQSNLFEFLQLPFQSFSHRFINRCLLIFIKVVPLNKN